MTLSQHLNPVYRFAAARGHSQAQAELAADFVRLANDDPERADEHLAVAETFGELACTSGEPSDLAVLAGVRVARSLHLESRDPVRSLDYRDQAEQLFDLVESSGDTQALGVVAFALNHLANIDPDDDRASARLNRIIETLSPAEAQMLREAVRTADTSKVIPQEQH